MVTRMITSERGDVLPRGDDPHGKRRCGGERRPTPAAHSTHSHYGAKVHQPRTRHDEWMTPSFMATEAKTRKAQDTERWESAEKEWQGLIRMGTFKIVPLSEMVKGERLYRTRFVRVEKSKYPREHPKRYKSRLVVQQMRGVFHEDAADVYAPTPSQEASRLITWFAATEGLQVHGLDCVQAYLNSPAPTEKGKRIFVHFPKERKREGWVLLLHKYLYGLRRAARAWATCLRKAFVKLGYKRLVTELCTYVKTHRDSTRTIAQVHVDDMKIVGKASKLIDALRKVGIEVTDEGPLTSHLGIQYVATSKGIFEHMERTTRRVLSDFGYAPGTCKKATTPLNDDSQWSTRGFKTGVNKLAKVDMRKIVGALLWIRRCVRLDIAVALHKLSVTSDDKRFEQEHRADQLLRYLASTRITELTSTLA